MGEITLYSYSECTRCPLVKLMLDKHNVQYTEVKDNKQLMIDKEIEQFPAIEIDGEIIQEYGAVLSWLDKNGWYSL